MYAIYIHQIVVVLWQWKWQGVKFIRILMPVGHKLAIVP